MRCLCSPSVKGCDPVNRWKDCEAGVNHCLLSVKITESGKYLEHIQDCWIWPNDVHSCPDVNGVCYEISESTEQFTNCCCKGPLCNNATSLEYVTPPRRKLNFTDANPIVKFGDSNQLLVTSDTHYPSENFIEQHRGGFLKLIVIVPTVAVLLFLILGIIFLSSCWPRLRIFRFKGFSLARRRKPCVHHDRKKNGLLLDGVDNLPPCTCDQACKVGNKGDKLDGQNECVNLNGMYNFSSGSPNRSAKDLIVDLPKAVTKIALKAHGRFGQVWHGQLDLSTVSDSQAFGLTSAQLSEGKLDVAIKIFSMAEKRSWETEVSLFHVPGLSHTNILRYYGADKVCINQDLDLPSHEFWLVTEYHKLGSLYDYLNMHELGWSELLCIAIGIARGLGHLHSEIPSLCKPSVAHRDLNSRNVLLKSDMTACIADFGLAFRFEPSQCTRDAHLQLGTRRYMAPEVLDGAIQFSRDAYLRIDVYAMGLVLWELMTRCPGSKPNLPPLNTSYLAPFELELGPQPTMEELQRWVAIAKQRPKFQPHWQSDVGFCVLWETVEECWDQDAEARLSAGCVAERLTNLYRQSFPIHLNHDSNNNAFSSNVPNLIDEGPAHSDLSSAIPLLPLNRSINAQNSENRDMPIGTQFDPVDV